MRLSREFTQNPYAVRAQRHLGQGRGREGARRVSDETTLVGLLHEGAGFRPGPNRPERLSDEGHLARSSSVGTRTELHDGLPPGPDLPAWQLAKLWIEQPV